MVKLFVVIIVVALFLNGCGYSSAISPAVVHSNKQQPQSMQMQRMVLSNKQMLKGKRLVKKVKKQLINARNEAFKVGGSMQVICPATVPTAVIKELESIGINYVVDQSIDTGYAIELSRENNKHKTQNTVGP